MMRRAHRSLLLTVACVLSGAVYSEAAIITYTSSAAFLAAAPGVITETYEALPVNSLIADGATVNNLTYDFPAGLSGRIDNLYNRIGNQSLAAAPPNTGFFFQSGVTVTFPSAVNAVGIFFNVDPSPLNTLQVQTSAGSAGNGPAFDISTLYFVGLISDVPFTSATFLSLPAAASGFNLDNLSYRVAAVPEPLSLVLLGLGLAGVGATRRRARS